MRTPWTVRVAPHMYFIGPGPQSGHRAPEPQSYGVEFFEHGNFVESHAYPFNELDEAVMLKRITSWIRRGTL